MIGYHVFIISTFPLAVPLEWNLMFIYITAFLFLGYPGNHEGYGLGDMDPVLLAVTVAALLFFPILGELRPRLVSFLPSLRQYSGNWATAMWAFAPGAEAKLDEHIVKPAPMQKDQLTEMFDADTAVRDAAPVPRLARAAQPGARAELGDDQPARPRTWTSTTCARARSCATR